MVDGERGRGKEKERKEREVIEKKRKGKYLLRLEAPGIGNQIWEEKIWEGGYKGT